MRCVGGVEIEHHLKIIGIATNRIHAGKIAKVIPKIGE